MVFEFSRKVSIRTDSGHDCHLLNFSISNTTHLARQSFDLLYWNNSAQIKTSLLAHLC